MCVLCRFLLVCLLRGSVYHVSVCFVRQRIKFVYHLLARYPYFCIAFVVLL